MISKIVLTACVLAGLLGALTISSLAVFTDTQTVPANTFTTGSIDISTNPTTALVTFSGMFPGDQVTAPITVTNAGTGQLRYAITSTTTENVLAAQLDLTIKSGVTTCTNASWAATGTVLYGPNDLGTTTGSNLVGNPAQGSQAGDRTLNASANEVLCVNVTLPIGTSGTTYQTLNDTATFSFQAQQTANN